MPKNVYFAEVVTAVCRDGTEIPVEMAFTDASDYYYDRRNSNSSSSSSRQRRQQKRPDASIVISVYKIRRDGGGHWCTERDGVQTYSKFHNRDKFYNCPWLRRAAAAAGEDVGPVMIEQTPAEWFSELKSKFRNEKLLVKGRAQEKFFKDICRDVEKYRLFVTHPVCAGHFHEKKRPPGSSFYPRNPCPATEVYNAVLAFRSPNLERRGKSYVCYEF